MDQLWTRTNYDLRRDSKEHCTNKEEIFFRRPHVSFIHQRKAYCDRHQKESNSISTINFAFAGATKSNTEYLMDEEKHLEKNLQATREEFE